MQTFLQRNAVPGKAGVYYEIAAAEAVRIFDLADKGGNAFFLGKIFVYGYGACFNDVVAAHLMSLSRGFCACIMVYSVFNVR